MLRSVWDWGEQFTDKDVALFTNPLYKKPPEQQNNARKSMAILPASAIPLPGLHNKQAANSRFSLFSPNHSSSPAHTQKSEVSIAIDSLIVSSKSISNVFPSTIQFRIDI